MDRKDFSNLGEEIKEIVSEALGNMDFDKLNQDINRTAKDVLEQAKAGLAAGKERFQSGRAAFRKTEDTFDIHGKEMQTQENLKGEWKQPGEKKQPEEKKGSYEAPQYGYVEKPPRVQRAYLSKRPSGSVSGMIMMVLGALLTSGFGMMAVAIFCFAIAEGLSGLLESGFFIFFLAALAFAVLAYHGNQKNLRVKRFFQYVRILGERTFCSLDELAFQIGKDRKFVINDVRKMISEGMFLQGYLDDQETCLIVTEESYRQYRTVQEEYKRREEKEKKAVDAVAKEVEYQQSEKERKTKKADSIYNNEEIDRELLEAYRKGKGYLDEISRANKEISEPEISAKVSHMEVVTRRIFKQVQLHPEQLEAIRRFMEYYLPTTLKLVTAYNEFDAQPVQGETITRAKQEIAGTLDTINDGFEKLLDSLFEAAALDISTDISVMNTIMAQEGLKKDAFEI